MTETFVETYKGCDIYHYSAGQVNPDAVYGSPCVTGWFFTAKAIRDRIDAHEELPQPTYCCEICGECFYSNRDLQLHIAAEHPEEPAPPEPPIEEPTGEWPWPLDSVQDWFNSLWDNVVSAPMNALNAYWTTHIMPKLEWVRDRIQDGLDWVYNELEPIISGIKTTVSNMWTGLTELIDDVGAAVGRIYASVTTWINKNITPVIDNILSAVGDMWDDISEQVQTGLDAVVASVSTTLSSIADVISNTVSAGIDWIEAKVTDTANSLWTSIGAGFDTVGTMIATSTGAIWDSTLGLAGDILSGMATSLGTALSGFWDWMLKSLGNTAEMIFGAVNFVVAKLKDGVRFLLGDFLNLLTDALTAGSPPKEIVTASEVLMQTTWDRQIEMINEAYKSDPTPEGLNQTALLIQGTMIAAATTAMGAGLAADLAHPLKTMGFRPTIREIVYWSGIPAVTAAIATTPTAIGLLTPLRYALMETWTPMVPPSTDIIRFSVREVYLPERREALIQYYPGGEYDRLMAKQGFKKEFREHYWMSHWVLPSISQLNEMLYRDIIDSKLWNTYVRYNDLIPEMISKLEKIIYRPYTRVDIRRMWDIGVVTDEEVYENYLWLGYDEEHAARMTLWTKAYVIAGDIRAMYTKGWIDEHGAREMLISVGVPKERADVFMKRLVKTGQADRMSDERDLTKTDILRMFKNGIFTANETIGFLQDIGYDEAEAAYLVQLYEYQPMLEMKELTMSQILKSYRYEVFTRDEAKTALLEAGWSEPAAETLLKLEDIKLKDAQTERARERDLSRSDIVRGISRKVIDKETGYNYLGYLGYSAWEINFIFALEGIE